MAPPDPRLPLYTAEGRVVTRGDFSAALRKVGVRAGDTIMVHSDVSAFGKIAAPDRDLLLGSLVEVFQETVTVEGTLIMPTFTYSFCENQVYDVRASRSRVGTLTEYFRGLPGTVRTRHPIFSVALWGKKKEEYARVGRDSFDDDSIFGYLLKDRGKIVVFGSPFNDSLTFIHYIEQKHGVPYRFTKSFSGTIREEGEAREETVTYLVRYLDRDVTVDLSRLERYLLNHGHMKRVTVGAGRISLVRADTLFRVGSRLLDRDIGYFLKEGSGWSRTGPAPSGGD